MEYLYRTNHILMLKRFLIGILCAASTLTVHADEGMWLPILLEQLNIEDMQARGFKLSAEDIYSVNHSSMKDAVVLFGGGCTGEMISAEGLLLTNHHCGFSSINDLSSLENNYLRDGFWAKNKAEEIPAPGLKVTFIISMHDVTDSILSYVNAQMDEATRAATIKQRIANLEASYKKGTHYETFVRAFYYGNAYYLFVTETFTDIRLVGAPPASVGNFGGETDNWVWPRHTGDFSIFRVYAGKDNKPAVYSSENVPFKPRYHFPISLKGVKEGDFTMVYGFPGRTQEYLTSYAVDLTINSTNPNRIECRDKRLAIMNAYMLGNDTVTLQYASKAKGLANAYKKWKGEKTGLELNDAIGKKQAYEQLFQVWANTHAGKDYRDLLPQLETLYGRYKAYAELIDYTSEAFFAVEALDFASDFESLISKALADTLSSEALAQLAAQYKTNAAGFFSGYDKRIDREMFATMLELYSSRVQPELQSPYFKTTAAQYKNNFTAWANAIFAKSVFTNPEKLDAMLTNFSVKKAKKMSADPMYRLYSEVAALYAAQIKQYVQPLQAEINILMRDYMRAQMLMEPDKLFYPDANSTLRVTYGNVKGYTAKDAVQYYYMTTDAGLEQKYKAGDEEFDLPKKLVELVEKNDFGPYADASGALPVAFIASNHTTGGNSGSPVINANGELIGTNYDRVWEGTMSDIMYDVNRCRNITLDIRYTLFIIDKYAGATNLIKELTLVQ
ncbi:MAG TPA: S46 family peptidase [Chitinophagales bacterium]|nr:S46 family peptidase [Chitinophagales bacterium]